MRHFMLPYDYIINANQSGFSRCSGRAFNAKYPGQNEQGGEAERKRERARGRERDRNVAWHATKFDLFITLIPSKIV